MTSVELPNHRYYRRNHGRWRSRFEFHLTDWRGFRACPMTPLDRLRVVLMAVWPKLVGRFWIDTEVDYSQASAATGEVVHTTRVYKWGMTLFESREVFTLHADGRDLAIAGEQRIWPARWRIRGFGDSRGQVDDTGTRATYEFEWFGARLHQTGEIVDDGVILTMDTGWGRGVQHLRVRDAGS